MLSSLTGKIDLERAIYMQHLPNLSRIMPNHLTSSPLIVSEKAERGSQSAHRYKSFVRSSLSAIHFSSISLFLTLKPTLNGFGFSVKLVNI